MPNAVYATHILLSLQNIHAYIFLVYEVGMLRHYQDNGNISQIPEL
jgi:hypothetical protein